MKIMEPSFELLAATGATDLPFSYSKPDELIERCGRLCYKSESKIAPGTAKPFVQMLRDRTHYAMLEHSWEVRFYDVYLAADYTLTSNYINIVDVSGVEHKDAFFVSGNLRALEEMRGCAYTYSIVKDESIPELAEELQAPELMAATVHIICDRGVTHELVRHRPCSYAQESTRWCNYGGSGISLIHPDDLTPSQRARREKHFKDVQNLYEAELAEGLKPEIARGVLPHALKTEIIVTANFYQWEYMFYRRTAKDAHPQMRSIMFPLWKTFAERWPKFFPPSEEDEYGD